MYVLGSIAPVGRARVARHLASCLRCRDEVAALADLPGLLHRLPQGPAPPGRPEPVDRLDQVVRMLAWRRRRHRLALATAVTLLVAAGVAGWTFRLSGAGPTRAAAAVLGTTRIGGATVLTADGYTVYWFAPDTSVVSACTGSCARDWPPVTGPAIPWPGMPGVLAEITRPDGTLQATWNGHPLYTATADTAPGQTWGDNQTEFGGTWYAVTMRISGCCIRPGSSRQG